MVADSHLIAEYLVAKYGDRLDAGLSAHDRALTTAFERLLEENLYWTAVHTRWTTDDAWAKTRGAFFGTMPAPLRLFVPSLARRGMLREMHGHGMGRHTPDEIHAIGCRDITAVADLLGDQSYMLGAEPHSLDASAYAFLANLLWAPFDSPIQRHAKARTTLEAYCQRMKARYYA